MTVFGMYDNVYRYYHHIVINSYIINFMIRYCSTVAKTITKRYLYQVAQVSEGAEFLTMVENYFDKAG